MSDILRSAFNNISSNVWSNDNHNNSDSVHSDNSFVGQNIELKGIKLRVERVIAEGGFGFVFKVRDLKSSSIYALKRLIASDNETKKEIDNEIEVLTRLQPHKHIMQFISWGKINQNIYLLLSEYCGCGSLKDITLPIVGHQQINRIVYQTCLAIERMHSLGITHRDLKIENILFDNNGIVKLCDFGSATTNSYIPDHNWTPIQRSLLEDEMCRHTTPMYRPPEILDTYLHLPINTSMDIWAFGCLLYCLKFGRHPFEDSAKLRIINCNYSVPPTANDSDLIVRIIKICIKVDPNERTTATDIIGLLEHHFVDLNSACVNPRQPTPTQPTIPTTTQTNPLSQTPGSAQPSFSLSGFTRYIKDTSSKVMQTVQNSIARQDLDLSFLTSRLIVMSYPAEGLESAYRNHIEDVKAFLESKQSPYIVVNISGRSYGYNRFGSQIKVFDGGPSWKDSKRAPTLASILSLCQLIEKWMSSDSKNFTVIHCMDGKTNCALLSAALFVWVGLFTEFNSALNFFAVKRTPIELSSSQTRYLSYVSQLSDRKSSESTNSETVAIIKSISLKGIPLFTKMRDGCRPFVEIFMNGEIRIASTANEYEKLRSYSRVTDNRIVWNDMSVQCDPKADILVVISHARSTIGSKMLQSKMTAIRISSLQFNLFLEHKGVVGQHVLKFDLDSLDDIEELDRFPKDFQLVIELDLQTHYSNGSKMSPKSQNFNEFKSSSEPISMFSNERELEECIQTFASKKESTKPITAKPERPPPPINLISKPKEVIEENTCEPKDNCLPKTSFFDSFQSEDNNGNHNIDNDFQNQNKEKNSKHSINDLLLNLSIDETTSQTENTAPITEIPSDLFQTTDPQMDLFAEINELSDRKTSDNLIANDSNVNLLNDLNLFSSDPITPPINPLPSMAAFDSKPLNATLKSPTLSAGPTLNSNSVPLQRNTSTPNLTNLDPLAQLGSFMSSTVTNTAKTTSTSIPRVASYSTFQSTANPLKPDYSRTHFEPKTNNSNNGSTSNTRVLGNTFEDLLGGFKPTQNDSTNKSIAQIRREEMLREGTVDPLRLKVMEWKEGKTRNIRALLCSLNVIIWEGCNWQPIGMHQLVATNEVKKYYRKACLAVHPDKLVGTEHEELAKLIFMELNDAWNEFEKQIQ